MPDSHLTHDEFFNKLGELFTSRKDKDHGSVFLTQKRLTFGTGAALPTKKDPLADIAALGGSDDDATSSTTTFPVIIHSTDGKGRELRKDGKGYQVRKDGRKVKLSTVVDSDALDAFYARYAEICKAGMVALKPRDRTKNKRKTKGKKKKGAMA